MSDRFDVSGLRTVVTGAASGLGLAMAEVMAENGARVTLVDVDGSGLEEAAARLPDTRTAVVDVADSAAVERLFAELDGVDVVFANAGVSREAGVLDERGGLGNLDDDTWRPDCSRGLSQGDSVALHPLTHCGECYPRRVGRTNVCDNFRLIGIHEDGGFQEQLLLREALAFPTSERRPQIAALAEPLSIAVRAINRSRLEAGERAVIFGAGPIGQAIGLLARERGASVLMIDTGDEFEEAVGFVERNGDRLGNLITQEFPLERAPEALQWAMDHPAEAMKVVIGDIN